MLGAIATTLCFAVTPVFANAAAHRLGSLAANVWRLALALLMLGTWVVLAGRGCPDAARNWFVLGGVVGFGVGGVAMFLSLPRLGSSLSTLLVQCLSAVVAATVEFVWLGQTLTVGQLAWAAGTLAGIAIGLLPRSLPRVSPAQFRAGVAWAVLSALGQGTGAVLSRKAFATAAAAHVIVDPGTAAFLRAVGGLALGMLVLAVAVRLRRSVWLRDARAWPWVLGNAITGPVLGVAFYQWALRGAPAGIVQPIVAVAPLLTIPFAAWIERAAPPRMAYYAGSVLAIGGATGLVLAG